MDYAAYLPYLWAVLFVLTLAAGWVMTLVSLPGNWLMVAAAVVFAFFVPSEASTAAIGWGVVIALLVLASIGELLELLASALGAARGGGSKRGAVLAVLGAVPGAMIGAVLGSPIPVIGTLVGVIVFAGLGAMGGAMLGEWWKGRQLHESWQVGQGAFIGRVLGSLAKVMIASIMLAVGTTAVFVG
jgi:uncharacterized protein YqgC (DUF456 family)